MALDWKTVKAEHVEKACDLLVSGTALPRSKAKGIFVVRDGERLPAKHVLRLAYCIAHRLPMNTLVKFSSGEGTVSRLRGLGFEVDYVRDVAAQP